jgi:hypothetical protein
VGYLSRIRRLHFNAVHKFDYSSNIAFQSLSKSCSFRQVVHSSPEPGLETKLRAQPAH